MDENEKSPEQQPADSVANQSEVTQAFVPADTQPVGAPTDATAPSYTEQPTAPVYAQQSAAPYAQAPVYATAPMAAAPANLPNPTPALVCGILAIVFSFIPIAGVTLGIVAIVLGGKYIKAGGTSGSAKGGKICGIIGIVFSVIVLILNIVLVVFAMQVLDDYDNTYSSSSRPAVSAPANVNVADNTNVSSSDSTDEMAAREAIDKIATERLDLIKNENPQMMASLESIAEESFEDFFDLYDIDLTMADCDIIPESYIKLMTTPDFSYEQVGVTVNGSTARATYYLTMKDVYDVLDIFGNSISDEASALNGMTDSEVKVKIGSLFIEAVEQAQVTDDNYLELTFKKTGDTWVMDEDQWDDEMDYLFGLF